MTRGATGCWLKPPRARARWTGSACSILLTSDEHLRGIDFERLTLALQAFDVAASVIATPREIVRKFFRR